MSRVIAIGQPEGAAVGKTTTAVNLAASLATAERKTLLVDADPQANSTSGVGIERDRIRHSLYDALLDGRSSPTPASPTCTFPTSTSSQPRRTWSVPRFELVNSQARER